MFKRLRENVAAAQAARNPGLAVPADARPGPGQPCDAPVRRADGAAKQPPAPPDSTGAIDRILGAEDIAARNRWGLYCVPMVLRQKISARQLLRGGAWQAETLDLLRRLARQGDVVHAGASFGPFLPGITSALAEGCTLWALEPHQDVFQAAESTALLNGLHEIELHDVALADRDALGYMPDCLSQKPRREILVNQIRLDSLIPPRRPVAVVHFAFEEGMNAALEGARRLIAAHRPVLVLERRLSSDWLGQRICTGYEFAGEIGRNFVYRYG